MSNPKYKVIIFDLDTKALKAHYPKSNWREAYKDIKNFLKENNFTHRQWSGYKSNSKLNDADILIIIDKMTTKFPWLSDCVRKFDVTDVGKTFDLAYMIKDKSAVSLTAIPEMPKSLPEKKGRTLNELIAEAHKEKISQEKNTPEHKSAQIDSLNKNTKDKNAR